MQDGNYDIRLKADGFNGAGALNLTGDEGEGGSHDFSIRLHMGGAGPSATGALTIAMDSANVHNTSIPPTYAVAMTGSSSADQFALLGVGPIGLIVELLGERRHC
jgi:hypothetical protein